MKTLIAAAAFLALAAGCATNEKDSAARAWQQAECNRVIDAADRERCMRRVNEFYGSVSQPVPPERPRR